MKTKVTILLLAIALSISAQQTWTSLNLKNNLPGMGERHGQSYGIANDNLQDAIEIAEPLKANNPNDIITIGGYNAEILLK